MTQTLTTALLAQMTAKERLDAATKGVSAKPGDMTWLWLLLIVVIVVVLIVSVWALYNQVVGRRRRAWQAFIQHADQLGLSDEERTLLHNIAGRASLDQIDLIFTSPDSFNAGLATLTTDNSVGLGQSLRMCGTCAYLQTLREKLGFQAPIETGKVSAVNLGKVPDGTVLTVMRQRSPENFQAAVASSDPATGELIVQPENNIAGHVGDSWLIRFPEGGILWEFNAWVVRTQDAQAVLKPSGGLRWINRRKFIRTSTNRPAHVAAFPFDLEDQAQVPQFVAGTLLEIAGPGLLLRAPIDVSAGERVLVVVELHRNKRIEGMGMVRRAAVDSEDGETTIAVELINLTTTEVAQLARETNQAHSATATDESADDLLASGREA